jgi:hypothetical protein
VCERRTETIFVKTQPTIYQIAMEHPGVSLADRLRVIIAKSAVEDPTWCETYDALLEAVAGQGVQHPEMFTLENGTRYEEPVLLADMSRKPADVVEALQVHARDLGADVSFVDDLDAAAAVVGVELWMASLETTHLSYAAAKGPDAIAAASALLARACGEGVPMMPLDPDWPSLRFPMEKVLAVASRARAWVETHLDGDAWAEVTYRVVTDLAYMAGGDTRTHEASLLLGVRMIDIAADV